jgi:hypothetical protein
MRVQTPRAMTSGSSVWYGQQGGGARGAERLQKRTARRRAGATRRPGPAGHAQPPNKHKHTAQHPGKRDDPARAGNRRTQSRARGGGGLRKVQTPCADLVHAEEQEQHEHERGNTQKVLHGGPHVVHEAKGCLLLTPGTAQQHHHAHGVSRATPACVVRARACSGTPARSLCRSVPRPPVLDEDGVPVRAAAE